MSEPSKHHDWVYDLEKHPEIATGIGHFTAKFAKLEFYLWRLYGIILGSDERAAQTLFGATQSFTAKLDAMHRYCEFRVSEQPELAQHIRYLTDAKGVNTFRNYLSHGMYMTDDSQTSVVVDINVTDPTKRKQTKKITLDATRIKSEIAALDALTQRIHRAIVRHDRGAHRSKDAS